VTDGVQVVALTVELAMMAWYFSGLQGALTG
jgi:hypothetical protein